MIFSITLGIITISKADTTYKIESLLHIFFTIYKMNITHIKLVRE